MSYLEIKITDDFGKTQQWVPCHLISLKSQVSTFEVSVIIYQDLFSSIGNSKQSCSLYELNAI